MTKSEREIFQRDLLVAISLLADAAQMKQPRANLGIAMNTLRMAQKILDRDEEIDV
ncbi:MAG TPA: hypothetical protein VE971_01335 [Candidatus Eisenbacteria bacterium]|nr:hypothetical protein [Candidatus Eisenbacteria bacterium]